MREIEAMFLDNDGTLTDTIELVGRSFVFSINYHGYPPKPREEIDKLGGLPLAKCYQILVPKGDIDKLCKTHNEFQKDNTNLARLYPNVLDTLGRIRQMKLKTAVITTRTRESALRLLKANGIDNLMDLLISKDEVNNLKPHPEPILKALAHLNVSAKKTFMVGDTDSDILAGIAAGVTTIGVTYGFQGIKIKDCNPDYIVNDFSEILPIISPN
jgi:pyrophosphatase PpaX